MTAIPISDLARNLAPWAYLPDFAAITVTRDNLHALQYKKLAFEANVFSQQDFVNSQDPAPKMPRSGLLTFSGAPPSLKSPDVRIWLNSMKRHAKTYNWSDEQYESILRSHLTGDALLKSRNLPFGVSAKYKVPAEVLTDADVTISSQSFGLIHTLVLSYVSATTKSDAREKIRVLSHRETESVNDFYNKLQNLCYDADYKLEDKYILERFISSIHKNYFALLVSQQPKTIAVALSLAQAMEASFQARETALASQLSSISISPSSPPSVSAVHSPPSAPRSIQCYYCKKMGHVKRNCPTRPKRPQRYVKQRWSQRFDSRRPRHPPQRQQQRWQSNNICYSPAPHHASPGPSYYAQPPHYAPIPSQWMYHDQGN